MAKKQMSWKTKGMNRDLSPSAFNPEFAFENRNLRLGTNEGNTMMSWVTERGTLAIRIVIGNWIEGDDTTRTKVTSITGTPIGTAVINHKLVIFTTDTLHDQDYIFVLKYADTEKTTMLCRQLFGGENLSLNFDIDHPLETLASYESEKIQKVYWVDGINQPRVINIEGSIRDNNTTQFDFVPTLQLLEDVSVQKMLGANGMFAPGVIQYAFTYYTKYGQESNIFYVTPLQYISFRDRGASPEEKVENAFRITVTGVDMNFDYLRIYSIQRTSVNATPICKRVQDICLQDLEKKEGSDVYEVSFIDTGTSGDSIDPTELLYKGGEVATAYTLEQKDNTLFLGNLTIARPQLTSELTEHITNDTQVFQGSRTIYVPSVSTGSYIYSNQLNSFTDSGKKRSTSCAGFKTGDVYRLGVQFQYKTGKWTDPVVLLNSDGSSFEGKDFMCKNRPSLSENNTSITLPAFEGQLESWCVSELMSMGYKRVRGVVVFPSIQDRTTLCQGVINPTLSTYNQKHVDKILQAQSSWFFRPYGGSNGSGNYRSGGKSNSRGATSPYAGFGSDELHVTLPYTSRAQTYNPIEGQYNSSIRAVEIQGEYDINNKYANQRDFVTFHSPDMDFDPEMLLTDFSNSKYRQAGFVNFKGTLSDIDIQTETSTISSRGNGFVHKMFNESGEDASKGIISGLFYDDYLVDENDEVQGTEGVGVEAYKYEFSPVKFMVYLWNKNGSLNNDFNRPAGKGTPSAILKKKVISNLRYANTAYKTFETGQSDWKIFTTDGYPQVFTGNEATILKLGNELYMGNIDTLVVPDKNEGHYFAFQNGSKVAWVYETETPFNSIMWWKTFGGASYYQDEDGKNVPTGYGIYKHDPSASSGAGRWPDLPTDSSIGETYTDLVAKREGVRIKYKSTTHLVFKPNTPNSSREGPSWENNPNISLPLIEIVQQPVKRYGGYSMDALKENTWIPAGEPVLLSDRTEEGDVFFKWIYGDTYFQRWDCLKTYPFTFEDPNQVVEIGSFMLETHVNIDGRYDRNRGQLSNINMSPINFNLLNPVYSQVNNFFQYKIQDQYYYANTLYPNQITWSRTKESGADVDLWTNMTLASTLELDGDKGDVTSLQRMNNALLCFQQSGLSQILYKENMVLSTTEGVPVEIGNSDKVQGKTYISDTVGCADKWSIASGTMGLYFMDSNSRDIYVFNGQLQNLSVAKGFNAWSKMYIPSADFKWTPLFKETNEKSAFVSYYDKMNQEILFINNRRCLAYSEKFGVFTSFYDYNNTPFFASLDDTGIWLRANQLWKHQSGEYCRFFGASRPYSMILVGNQEPQTDKIFTNVEFRACVAGDGALSGERFTPYLPFDSLDTWNEYQHGVAYLDNMRGHSAYKHHTLDNEASLKRKFRIWRCDIPRDNGDNQDTFDETFDETFHPLARLQKHPLDRMRNPWLYLRLRKSMEEHPKRAEIHDIVMTYFN